MTEVVEVKNNEVDTKKKIIVLTITTLLIIGITFLSWPLAKIENSVVKTILKVLLNLSNGAVAFVAIKIKHFTFFY